MRDRGLFWTPVPDWAEAELDRSGLRVSVTRELRQLLLVSGEVGAFISRRGVSGVLGPRDLALGPAYALRLAPDRVLCAFPSEHPVDLGWSEKGFAVADVTEGIIAFDVEGRDALALLQQGMSYDLTALDSRPAESCNIVLAGLRVAIVRRPEGWRLHVERPFATAVWTWLKSSIAHVTSSGA
ncbi:MAG: hypothetical protein R3D57_02530 [Hyphomicrobiaceae bacterium]